MEQSKIIDTLETYHTPASQHQMENHLGARNFGYLQEQSSIATPNGKSPGLLVASSTFSSMADVVAAPAIFAPS